MILLTWEGTSRRSMQAAPIAQLLTGTGSVPVCQRQRTGSAPWSRACAGAQPLNHISLFFPFVLSMAAYLTSIFRNKERCNLSQLALKVNDIARPSLKTPAHMSHCKDQTPRILTKICSNRGQTANRITSHTSMRLYYF
jgi:hypothetical protein